MTWQCWAAGLPACRLRSSSSSSARKPACCSPRSAPSPRARPRSRSASRASRSARTTTARSSACATTSRSAQLRKHGLRFFLPAERQHGLHQARRVLHARAPRRVHAPDRPRHLRERAVRPLRRRRAPTRSAASASRTSSSATPEHTITLGHEHGDVEVTARWIVDATGRGNFMRRKLGIGTETGHDINAAWFRLAGGLDWETEWGGDDEEWLDRMPERGLRNYSTTHLVDEGYWLWLIQLASGPISIGVCADPRLHPFEEINSFDAFLDWMKEHEPQLARVGRAAAATTSSTSCGSRTSRTRPTQPFSQGPLDAWWARRSASSTPSTRRARTSSRSRTRSAARSSRRTSTARGHRRSGRLLQRLLLQAVRADAAALQGQLPVLRQPAGHGPEGRLRQHSTTSRCWGRRSSTGGCEDGRHQEAARAVRGRAIPLSGRMQQLFMDWHELEQTTGRASPSCRRQFDALHPRRRRRWPARRGRPAVRASAREAPARSRRSPCGSSTRRRRTCPSRPTRTRPINPLAISLHPERWEQDGLFSDDGISLAQAREMLVGIEEMDLEARGAAVAG